MHTDNPHLIKDRRHHFRMYTSCFVGKEAVDWLVESGQATDRDTAIFAMNVLLSKDVIRHGMFSINLLHFILVSLPREFK